MNHAVLIDHRIAVGRQGAAQSQIRIQFAGSGRSTRFAASRLGESRRAVGLDSPRNRRSSVVLPLPFGPTSPTRIPAVIRN